uniref:Uncharacterized protein n=1 Tax=Eutreptiella gymnastica TaxID=73025 RepID=A0A7S1HV24_9EUGL|mmetsp:Transcript_107816/g.185863  ORF Transcript_107816/g.185863 Transcript_107816/m.185863 type:complete len:117 (+) Transcript_107816:68-418(+)
MSHTHVTHTCHTRMSHTHRRDGRLPPRTDLRGPKLKVSDADMLSWMDAQEEASLSPFKTNHIDEFKRRIGDGNAKRYAGSGERWWRNFKKRYFKWLADPYPATGADTNGRRQADGR